MERALDQYLAWNDLILGSSVLGETVQPFYLQKFGLNKHSTIAEIEKICGERYVDEYYTFALVRHPVGRLCSVYNFVGSILTKWAEKRNIAVKDIEANVTPKAATKKPSLNWASSRAFLHTNNFSEFIRHPELRREPAFRTQLSSLVGGSTGSIKAQSYRLEDRELWKDTLGKRLGCDLQFPHANASDFTFVSDDAVNANDREYIAYLFAADFAAFGYQP